MRTDLCNRIRGLVGATVLLLLCSPVEGFASERVIWQSGLDYIALETVGDAGQINDHPYEIPLRELVNMLKDIKLADGADSDDSGIFDFLKRKGDRSADDHLFNEPELRKISKPVADALARARGNEDVVFRVNSSRPQKLGKSDAATTGRIFFDGRYLNLLIGELRVDLEQRYRIRGGPSDFAEKVDYYKLRAFRLDRGSREKPNANYAFLADGTFSLKSTENGGVRADWLLMDVTASRADQNGGTEVTEQLPRESESAEVVGVNAGQEPPASRKNDEKADTSSAIEARLLELRRLYEKGLIPEDIYKQKVTEVLDQI